MPIKRTYLYRLAVPKYDRLAPSIEHQKTKPEIPFHSFRVFEHLSFFSRSKYYLETLPAVIADNFTELSEPIDSEKFESALALYKGSPKNFASFTTLSTLVTHWKFKNPGEKFSLDDQIEKCYKDIQELTLKKIPSPLSPDVDPLFRYFEFYDVKIAAKSFLFHQVRRMIGAALCVAQRKLKLSDLQNLLDKPSPQNWLDYIPLTKPNGLYLVNVEYPPQYLYEATDAVDHLPIFPSPPPPKDLIQRDKIPRHILRQQNTILCNANRRMDFLLELKSKKKNLNPTTTIVRNTDGKSYIENCKSGTLEPLSSSESHPGYILDTQPDTKAAEIIPGRLFLGSQDAILDVDYALKVLGITHVLNVASGVQNLYPDIFVYKNMELLDVPEEKVKFQECCNFIHKVLEASENRRVLVHCNAGVSRAATVTIAYLMIKKGMTLHQAFKHVKARRPVIRPNDGFLKQLRALDKSSTISEGCCDLCCTSSLK